MPDVRLSPYGARNEHAAHPSALRLDAFGTRTLRGKQDRFVPDVALDHL
jgi:hypothetical protein